MQYILFEDALSSRFLPLTYTRPVYSLRLGVDRIEEKWSRLLGQPVQGLPHNPLLQDAERPLLTEDTVFINGRYLPDSYLVGRLIKDLQFNQGFFHPPDELIAFRTSAAWLEQHGSGFIDLSTLPIHVSLFEVPDYRRLRRIAQLTDLFTLNGEQLRLDVPDLAARQPSQPITDPHTVVYAPENVWVGEGVKIRAAVLNAEDGPIYIGPEVQIMEGAMIHGAHAIGAGSTVQMGARLRGDTTLGPGCKVGGEVSNSVFQGLSNKSHDGFLGNSIIGEWCNLGAGSTCSNLKNNYSTVRLYSHLTQKYEDTGLLFCGLTMGDFSRAGIQTLFNTGTVVGVCCNLFGAELPPKFVPSFSWGQGERLETYRLEAAFETIDRMMSRRDRRLEPPLRRLLQTLFDQTERFRYWEY